MKINIVRSRSTQEGTPGILTTDAGFTCKTLELPWANNQSGISCIFADIYTGGIWYSPHLNRLVIRLEDKHGRQNCLVHNGNFAGEGVNEVTQIHGCTEVGNGYGQLDNGTGRNQFAIEDSSATLALLIAHIKSNIGDDPFTVSYAWDTDCEPADLSDKNASAVQNV